MKIKITKSFSNKLNKQVDYIAKDKPAAARKFKNDVLAEIKSVSNMPYRNRKSIFFDNNDIREFIFKGYIIVYRINKLKNRIEFLVLQSMKKNRFSCFEMSKESAAMRHLPYLTLS